MAEAALFLCVILAVLSGHGGGVAIDLSAFGESLAELANTKLGVETVQVLWIPSVRPHVRARLNRLAIQPLYVVTMS